MLRFWLEPAYLPHFALLATLAAAATPLAAQTPAPSEGQSTAAAASINAADLARHINVITADSMKGYEMRAQYIADQFKRLGLLPNGDKAEKVDSAGEVIKILISRPAADGGSYYDRGIDSSFVQRYPLLGSMTADYQTAHIRLSVKLRKKDKLVVDDKSQPVQKAATLVFTTDAIFACDTVPQSGAPGNWTNIVRPTAFVVVGPHTVQSVRQAKLRDKLILYVPHERTDSATQRQIVELLYASNHVLVLSGDDSAAFAARWRAANVRPPLLVDQYMEEALGVRHWAAYVRPDPIKSFLVALGLDVAEARGAVTPIVRELPPLQATLTVYSGPVKDRVTASNVIGTIPGSDSDTSISNQYIVYSANMDHTVGVAGLIELAKAFSQQGARPRRSILFVALSGAKDFSGANYFISNSPMGQDLAQLAANITIGSIGLNSPDSVTVNGIHDIELSARPDWITGQHPELKLAVADGGSISTANADHLPFIRKALPSFYFYSGNGSIDAAAKVDPAHAVRILRLAFYLGQDIVNANRKPGWTEAGRRNRIRLLGQ